MPFYDCGGYGTPPGIFVYDSQLSAISHIIYEQTSEFTALVVDAIETSTLIQIVSVGFISNTGDDLVLYYEFICY